MVSFGIINLILGWKLGDWRKLEKYYPTILFLIIGDLLYNIFTYGNLTWSYNDNWLFPNHIINNLWIMLTGVSCNCYSILIAFP